MTNKNQIIDKNLVGGIIGGDKLKELYPGLDDDCYQPCSIDLKIGKISQVYIPNEDEIPMLSKDDKRLPKLYDLQPFEKISPDGTKSIECYMLEPQVNYMIFVEDKMEIPEGMMQLYYLRSSLMRMGVTSETCVGDPGYKGVLQFSIKNNNRTHVALEKGARFATAVTYNVIGAGKYDGQYQEE